jgi:hypothetical protein
VNNVSEAMPTRLAERHAGRPASGQSPESAQAEVEAQVAAMLAYDRLNETALLTAAQRGETRLCTVMLAVAAEVPVAAVERAATRRSAKAMLSVVWKAGFSPRVGGPLQALLCHLTPDSAPAGRDGGTFPLSIDEMRWQIDFLQRNGR